MTGRETRPLCVNCDNPFEDTSTLVCPKCGWDHINITRRWSSDPRAISQAEAPWSKKEVTREVLEDYVYSRLKDGALPVVITDEFDEAGWSRESACSFIQDIYNQWVTGSSSSLENNSPPYNSVTVEDLKRMVYDRLVDGESPQFVADELTDAGWAREEVVPSLMALIWGLEVLERQGIRSTYSTVLFGWLGEAQSL